jgi:cell division protein FtsB
MLRYLEGCAGAKDSVIEKLKLKNTSLKTQISKLEQQLQQKEEMGEVGWSLRTTCRTAVGA